MPKWKKYFRDEGWLQEGHILFFETQNLEMVKTVAGERVGQHITLPTEGITLCPGDKILLKFRSHSRCMYGQADVLEVRDDEMTVYLPQNYDCLNRAYFYRVDLFLPAKLNRKEVQLLDLSIAGAALSCTNPDVEEGNRYLFQLGRFSTQGLVREIKDGWIRVQFPLRDNLNTNLANILRNTIKARSSRRRTVSV